MLQAPFEVSVQFSEAGRCTGIALTFVDTPTSSLVRGRTLAALDAFFEKKPYGVEELDFSGCRKFDRKIYDTLLKVPFGTTVTYGQLAKQAGFPRAARAVGSAMARNPFPLVVPCHRVVPSTGGVGQYAGGRKVKQWLLDWESGTSR